MNFIIGVMGANLTLGAISGVATTANGIYSIISNIINISTKGSDDVKQIITDLDLEVKIKTIHLVLEDIVITEQSTNAIKYCANSIKNAIDDISNELNIIQYRMQYNNNIWIGATVRCYKFNNCRLRLHAKLKILESRYCILLGLLNIDAKNYNSISLVESNKSIQLIN